MKKTKHEKRQKILDRAEIDEEMRFRLAWLTVKEMEHDRRMRRKAIRLSQKRRRQADSLVI